MFSSVITENLNQEILAIDLVSYQGLIQKEKVHIDSEKGAQISILANKIATQWWPDNIIKKSKQTIYYIYFLFSR